MNTPRTLVDLNAPRDPRLLSPQEAIPGDFVTEQCSFRTGFVVNHCTLKTGRSGKSKGSIALSGLMVRDCHGEIQFFPYGFVKHIVRDLEAQRAAAQ